MTFKMLAKEVDGKVYDDLGGCPQGTCPVVIQGPNGNLIVVGSRLSSDMLNEVQKTGLVTVYEHEMAIEINPELIRVAASQLK